MLSDEQVNELENLIVYSELNQLPLILSRAIPILFSELRVVRAALDEKTSRFLGGFDDRVSSAQVQDPRGDTRHGEEAVDRRLHVGPERVESPSPVPASEEESGVSATPGGGSVEDEGGNSTRRRSRRGRNSKAAGQYQGILDGRTSEPAVGGEIDKQDGRDGPLPISAHPKLEGGA